MTETRAEKAQRLVDEGRVKGLQRTEFGAGASVKGDSGPYPVLLYPNGHYFCLCNWGRIHSHTDDLCAHALAVQIVASQRDCQ